MVVNCLPICPEKSIAGPIHKRFLSSPTLAPKSQSQSRPDPSASSLSPTDPTLRANPFPEVTDPICRLPLPTLFCRLEAVHLGDLLRILVRPGTRFTLLRGVFKGRWKRAGHRKSRGALRNICPYLGSNPFQGACSLQRKENSSRASVDVPHFVCVTARGP